jgi:LuxR family transcriptional regulator, maltose regulon positive regulatory protein
MVQDTFIIRTKLIPPRLSPRTLARPRLTERLLQARDHCLTLLQAGTGYGKSTALAALTQTDQPLIWYQLHGEDSDPFVFLLHLLHGFMERGVTSSHTPLALFEAWERNRRGAGWTAVLDALSNDLAQSLNGPLLLIIDDAHRLQQTTEPLRMLDHFIGRAPAHLHTILATRTPLKLPTLVRWRVTGDLLEIGQAELAFTAPEIDTLFRQHYNHALTLEQAAMLVNRVEGWPIALQLIWQHLQRDGGASLAQALGRITGSASDLFTYLAQEVLAQQPADVRHFLTTTAVLRQMTPQLCDDLRQAQDSDQLLRYLVENGLFVAEMGDGHLRYHYLFRDLLRHQLDPAERQTVHRRAAACYQAQGDVEEVVYHLLAAEVFDETAVFLAQVGRKLVQSGRLDTLAGWLASLPPDSLEAHPPLLTYLGDIARLQSRFDEALGWYRQAEARSRAQSDRGGASRALRGQARVYLDTVNPSQAEQLLQEALRLADGQEDRESRARLLDLLAENLLNQGRTAAAQSYQAQAQSLRQEGPGEAELPVRLLLRTGRLAAARRLLEEQAALEEQEPVQRPRAHRETLLLLSLILSFQGEAEAAYDCARRGTERGQLLHSDFVTAVGYMRQGHAWLLRKDGSGFSEAIRCFRQAIAISETIMVPRLKVEANWGLCQAYGFQGDLDQAQQAAEQGIALARQAGDEWIEAGIRLAMGAGLVLAGQVETARTELAEVAVGWLAQAGTGFHDTSDSYGETVVRLWQALLWRSLDDEVRLRRDVADLLQRVQSYGYDFLFMRPVLLGPPDPHALVPLLLFARDHGLAALPSSGSVQAVAERLLDQLGLSRIQIHPGYQLRLQTLGPFRLWRGREEVATAEWKRRKARLLFLLLLTQRHTSLDRDQISELLWPDQDPEAALRDFKVSFSTMCSLLEPARQRNAPSAYVDRDESRYGWRTGSDLWLDVDEFEWLIAEGDRLLALDQAGAVGRYRRALDLYQGDYLEEYPYEPWAAEERERLRQLYLRTAQRLAEALLAQQEPEAALAVTQAMLARDDCWEQAYRLQMLAFEALGNRAQALRTYQRCTKRLQAELAVEPTAVTVALYERIVGNGEP